MCILLTVIFNHRQRLRRRRSWRRVTRVHQIYIHRSIDINICIYIYTRIYICLYIRISIYIYAYIHMYVYILFRVYMLQAQVAEVAVVAAREAASLGVA